MNTPPDGYWDELGVVWRASDPDAKVLAPRLSARLRRQSLLITSGLVIGLPACALGLGLGVFTIWRGWSTGTWNFVTRGAAITGLAVLLTGAMSTWLAVRAGDAAKTVSQMIDLAIARAHRMRITIRLGFVACAVAAVMGLVGTVLRSRVSGPPQLSPVVDVAILVIVAFGLWVYGRGVRVTLDKLRALKNALDVDGGA